MPSRGYSVYARPLREASGSVRPSTAIFAHAEAGRLGPARNRRTPSSSSRKFIWVRNCVDRWLPLDFVSCWHTTDIFAQQQIRQLSEVLKPLPERHAFW